MLLNLRWTQAVLWMARKSRMSDAFNLRSPLVVILGAGPAAVLGGGVKVGTEHQRGRPWALSWPTSLGKGFETEFGDNLTSYQSCKESSLYGHRQQDSPANSQLCLVLFLSVSISLSPCSHTYKVLFNLPAAHLAIEHPHCCTGTHILGQHLHWSAWQWMQTMSHSVVKCPSGPLTTVFV